MFHKNTGVWIYDAAIIEVLALVTTSAMYVMFTSPNTCVTTMTHHTFDDQPFTFVCPSTTHAIRMTNVDYDGFDLLCECT